MLTLTLPPNPIQTHNRAPNPNRLTSIDTDTVDNFNNNLWQEIRTFAVKEL